VFVLLSYGVYIDLYCLLFAIMAVRLSLCNRVYLLTYLLVSSRRWQTMIFISRELTCSGSETLGSRTYLGGEAWERGRSHVCR